MSYPESTPHPEVRGETLPSIRLELIRHDRREPATPERPDEQSPLTVEGRGKTREAGQRRDPNARMAVAYGSHRVRAQETAVRNMLANEPDISEDLSFQDILDRIDAELRVGGKLRVDKTLSFKSDADPEFRKIYYDHYAKTKDLMPFLYHESDALVRKLRDEGDYSYSRMAGNIAALVRRYVDVLPNWQNVYAENEKKYGDQRELQRFIGTHSTLGESFLLKVIEKTEGREAAEQFIDALPDKNGIDFSEGIRLDIRSEDAGTKVRITFKDQSWEVAPELIDAIIADRDDLDQSIREAIKRDRSAG